MRPPESEAFHRLLARGAPLAELAAAADRLDERARVALVRSLRPRELKKLWERAQAGHAPLGLDFLFPRDAPPGRTAEWPGCNSLPLSRSFSKRFTRSPRSGELVGHNRSKLAPVVGPGYFTARERPEQPEELLFDYGREPPEAPAGWPPLKANSRGLRRLVFGRMQDRVRAVGAHLAVGAAFNARGRSRHAYFAIARAGLS